MATQSLFPFWRAFQSFNRLEPPACGGGRGASRVVLLNHVLMQEPQAQERLARQKGAVVLVRWRVFTFRSSSPRAGLFDVALA